ncbi:MAG: site-specific DNA-methyltransferase [Spirochaetaceae bacterium]|jgi:site-specific DNA-methyltransferase (adenine-specific)|nr:site-specific DNA-methyltransferase [Spirochaetaceae bacterium]
MDSYNTEGVHLSLGDAVVGMKGLADNSFDLAICDPPYGAASCHTWNYDKTKNIGGFGGNWKLNSELWDLLSQNDNFAQTFIWLSEIKRLVKPSGSLWVHATYHNGGFANVCCQLLGLEIINEVVWFKRNAFPNLSARRLTASHEGILWAHTGGDKREYLFNYDAVKSARFPEDRIKEEGKQLRTVWDIPNNKTKEELRFGSHPTQKPMRLTTRLLLISAQKGGKLLVPFSGSGTEILAGLKYDMEISAFETNREYFDLSVKRIERYFACQKEELLLI